MKYGLEISVIFVQHENYEEVPFFDPSFCVDIDVDSDILRKENWMRHK